MKKPLLASAIILATAFALGGCAADEPFDAAAAGLIYVEPGAVYTQEIRASEPDGSWQLGNGLPADFPASLVAPGEGWIVETNRTIGADEDGRIGYAVAFAGDIADFDNVAKALQADGFVMEELNGEADKMAMFRGDGDGTVAWVAVQVSESKDTDPRIDYAMRLNG